MLYSIIKHKIYIYSLNFFIAINLLIVMTFISIGYIKIKNKNQFI